MNLLARTIEEYLDEHHKECTTTQANEYICITSKRCPTEKYIIINSQTQRMIVTGRIDIIAYTEITILPLLTSIISQLEVK